MITWTPWIPLALEFYELCYFVEKQKTYEEFYVIIPSDLWFHVFLYYLCLSLDQVFPLLIICIHINMYIYAKGSLQLFVWKNI